MGLFKKIFKPVSKVLDKIIPNEIKPALPYVAAFAPFMMPPGFGTGFASGLFKTQAAQQMAARSLLGGGANVLGQLSQEGSEGDINLLSAGIGALSGAMTAPGAADTFAGMTTKGAIDPALSGAQQAKILADRGFLTKAADVGLTGLAKGSEMFAAGIDKPFSAAGLKAATIPAATATGDVMEAQQRLIDKQAVIDAALEEATGLADSAASALAIRNAMEAYGFFSEDEILDTIASAGYKAGGRVGFKNAGLAGLTPDQMNKESSSEIDNKPIIIKFYSKEDSGRRNEAFYEIMDPITGSKSNISQEDYIEKYGEPKANGGIMATEIPLKDSVKNINKKGQPDTTMIKMKEGGLMNLGGKEMDLRGGGFVPIGKKERADDVPARLSKNEFVMTADAVRAAGGGSVNEGAKRMYDVMNKLEARA